MLKTYTEVKSAKLEGPCPGEKKMEERVWEGQNSALRFFWGILLTVQLNTFISVFNHLDAQNLFHSKFYFIPLHVSSTCAHHQEVKIALHSLWYHCETNFVHQVG